MDDLSTTLRLFLTMKGPELVRLPPALRIEDQGEPGRIQESGAETWRTSREQNVDGGRTPWRPARDDSGRTSQQLKSLAGALAGCQGSFARG